jgi:hypothetical protein
MLPFDGFRSVFSQNWTTEREDDASPPIDSATESG